MRTTWALAAAAAVAGGVIAAPAGLASAETPQELINRLQGEGYTVNIDRIGTAPINECVVTNVRNPKTITQLVPYIGPGDRDNSVLIPRIVSQSISVTLDCTR
ncbi:hypothetical protein [Mycobacterium hubeiense]|uniref:hypothetical protein n=1 Tax=Mycobacterium hubeiense TaxID=1867256 RepID=UPI000C7EBB95|nr:hypothetical protein [Mycobacterium sp. QGD 101]